MSDKITSECPAFKKGWSPDIEECVNCKEKFPDEYSSCKKACDPVDSKNTTAVVEEPKAADTKVTAVQEKPPVDEKPEPSIKMNMFKGFREGSRADVLVKYLIEVGACSFDEAAEHLAKAFDIEKSKGLANVKDYCREWSRGKWNGKEVDLPFVVVIEDDAVACDSKETNE